MIFKITEKRVLTAQKYQPQTVAGPEKGSFQKKKITTYWVLFIPIYTRQKLIDGGQEHEFNFSIPEIAPNIALIVPEETSEDRDAYDPEKNLINQMKGEVEVNFD